MKEGGLDESFWKAGTQKRRASEINIDITEEREIQITGTTQK